MGILVIQNKYNEEHSNAVVTHTYGNYNDAINAIKKFASKLFAVYNEGVDKDFDVKHRASQRDDINYFHAVCYTVAMVVLDVVTVLMAIGVLIAIVVSLFGKWNLPTIVLIGVIAEIALAGYFHNAYKYEMTKESEQRVHETLMEMSADEYTQLVNQVKLADLNQIDDVMMRLIAKHVKDINTPRL